MDSQTSQNLLAKIRQEKEAQDPVTAAAAVSSKQLRSDAINDIAKIMLYGAGLGAAGRGAHGLYNLFRRNTTEPKNTGHGVEMPLPYTVEDEEKTAASGDSYFGSPVTQKESLWFYYPGMLLGGLAAGYGGWKGVDAVLDKRRKGEIEDELEGEKSKFRQALLKSYDKPYSTKAAADEGEQLVKMGEDLDALFDTFQEKQATVGDMIGKGLGGYATYAIPTALLAGYAAYAAGKKRQRKAVIDKALKQRNRRRSMQQPAPLFATPVEVKQDEEEALA
jgi:hypothetical protein